MSSRPRIFASAKTSEMWQADTDSVRHLNDVLRIRSGDQVDVVLDRVVYTVQITALHVKLGQVIGSVVTHTHVLPTAGQIHLIQGLPKGDKLAEIVRCCTEMGVATIAPVGMTRSISTPTVDRSDKKQIRWQQVAASAAAQSRQVAIPSVAAVTSFEAALKPWATRPALKLIFWETCDVPLTSIAWESPDQDVVMVIGPEGGITDLEVAVAVQAGFIPVSLGPTILRVEHAALVAMAQLEYARLAKRTGKG